jgi:hypothetical protein
MCGTPDIGDITRAGLDVMTFGTAEIGGISSKAGDLANRTIGGKSSTYKPTLLPSTDPTMELAQSGGAALLTNIALGANVDDALASHFGRSSGEDFKAWYNGLKPDQQAAIDGVKTTLTQIQTNTDLRNTAVQNVVKDFPNIVSMTAPKVLAAKQAAGEEFDQASKGYLDFAMKAIAAKSGGSGTVSSGANIQAAADAASKIGLDRLAYTNQAGNQELGLLGQEWQNNYTEANALRSFQQKMLGNGASEGFSASQNALDRQANINTANTGATNQANAAKAAQDNAFSSQLLGLGGTAAIYGMFGPAAAAAKGATNPPSSDGGASDYGFSGPATPGYAQNNVGPSGGYR